MMHKVAREDQLEWEATVRSNLLREPKKRQEGGQEEFMLVSSKLAPGVQE